MPNSCLVLGSCQPEARAFISAAEKAGLSVIPASRDACDITDTISMWAFMSTLQGVELRYVVSFFTPPAELAESACANVCRLIKECGIRRFVYVSAFRAVLEPDAHSRFVVSERAYRAALDHDSDVLRIVRPGVVAGPKTALQRLLTVLDYVAVATPAGLMTCVVDADELASALVNIAGEEKTALRTHCVLGKLVSLRSMLPSAKPTRLEPVLEVLRLVIMQIVILACAFFPALKHYMLNGVSPNTEEDVLALCSPHNKKGVQVLGRGAICKYYKQSFPGKLPVSMRNHSGIVKLTPKSVVVRAGTTFADLLQQLGPTGRTLLVHPNYSSITAGAAVMVPVHGSSLKHPLVNSCVLSVRYLNGSVSRRLASACTARVAHTCPLPQPTIAHRAPHAGPGQRRPCERTSRRDPRGGTCAQPCQHARGDLRAAQAHLC